MDVPNDRLTEKKTNQPNQSINNTKSRNMGKNKKNNRWNNQPRKQQNPLTQRPIRISAPKAVCEYWANELTEEERQVINTPMQVANHAGVLRRLGYLTATFYHIHNVQSLIFGNMQNLLEKWGLLLKGVRPAINSLQYSEDNFFKVMQELVDKYSEGIKDSYCEDVDALYDRVTRWEGIPKVWEPGDKLRLDEDTKMDGIIGDLKDGKLKLKEQDLLPEQTGDATKSYAIVEMNENEMGTIVRQDIPRKGLAAIQANKLARKNKGKMYVIFEQKKQAQLACHITPIKAVQMPQNDQGELVEIFIAPPKDKAKRGKDQ